MNSLSRALWNQSRSTIWIDAKIIFDKLEINFERGNATLIPVKTVPPELEVIIQAIEYKQYDYVKDLDHMCRNFTLLPWPLLNILENIASENSKDISAGDMLLAQDALLNEPRLSIPRLLFSEPLPVHRENLYE